LEKVVEIIMPQWLRIADVEQCRPGSACEIIAGERVIALYHVDDQFYALDGICPHQGGPLAQGKLEGCIVTCPWHGWQYDVRTGQHQSIHSLVHRSYPVKVEGSDIYVDLDV
jgi:nitrite reductase (NADH) small subunit